MSGEQLQEKLTASETMLQQKMAEVDELKCQLADSKAELKEAREDEAKQLASAALWCDKANWAHARLSEDDKTLCLMNGFRDWFRAQWKPELTLRTTVDKPEGVCDVFEALTYYDCS